MKTPSFWQTRNLIHHVLLPLSVLYRLGAWLDRTFTTPQHADLPVISIGNITAGGAGKTPVVLALIPILRALGHTPHILTRGYGGAQLVAHRVHETDDWQRVGDEALLLANAAPTWVGRNRLASAQAARTAGATILVCDDALQHHALHNDISLLIIDGPYGFGNGALLPAGPLREPIASALERCDAAIIIGTDSHHLATTIALPHFKATLEPTAIIPTLGTDKWLAFAGIGRPEKFFDSLRTLGANLVATHSYADHHAYTTQDCERLTREAHQQNARLITTAKDAVKLPHSMHRSVTILPIELRLEHAAGFIDFLTTHIGAKAAP